MPGYPDPASSKRPTTRDIARLASVSPATVSLALRNHASISGPTRARIRRIATRLGYRPDPEVSRLMHHLGLRRERVFRATLAALTTIPEELEPPYVTSLRAGARATAEALGYAFTLFRLDPDAPRGNALQRTLRARGVAGLLLLPMWRISALDSLLAWDDFAAVSATYGVASPDLHRVAPDQFANTLLLCRRLAAQGRRRIAYVSDAARDPLVDHRFAAAVLWHSAADSSARREPWLHATDFGPGLRAWFERQAPDAIITNTADEAHRIARALGLDIPGAVEFALTEHPPDQSFAGIDQRPALIGSTAVALLHARLQCGERGIPPACTATLVKGSWVRARLPALART